MPALSSLRPGWIAGYRRDWLRPDLIAGVVIWSVVTPQRTLDEALESPGQGDA